jgi:hypothetical protein
MGEIVNLRRSRKDRERREAETRAANNRAAFGRTRAEKDVEDARRDLDSRRLEGHRLTDKSDDA